MKFALLVMGSPYNSQSSDSAWRFAQALCEQGHELYRVFFYGEGVYQGDQLGVSPQDEPHCGRRWAEMAQQSGAELVLCVASAVKRGLLDERETERHDKAAASVHPGFTLSGLGQLIDAHSCCDRIVTFGD